MYFQNQQTRLQQSTNIINRSHINNEENEKHKEEDIEYKGGDKIVFALKRDYISKYLVNFCKNEKNKKLDELFSDLISYKINKKYFEPFSIKSIIFDNIEKMIIEISCLRNEEIRQERIQKLYLWYKEKIKNFEDLRKIQEKSYKEKNEIDDEDLLHEKEIEKENEEKGIIINEEEKKVKEYLKHRNKDFLYKDMLQDYRHKKLGDRGYSREKKKYEELETPQKPDGKLMYKTISATSFKNYSHTGEMTTFYSTKNGQNTFTLNKNSGLEGKKFYSLFNNFNNRKYYPLLNRETKFSYSYNRPRYDYQTMIIENNIMKNKLRELSEKRSKEEIQEKIEIFGTEKAKYKENVINKYELKSIINMYSNTNDFNSNLLQKYKTKSPLVKRHVSRRLSGNKELKLKESNVENNMNKNKDKSKENTFKVRNNYKRSYSQVVKKFNFLKDVQKMEIDKIKNLDNNTKSVLEKDKEEIKVVKIKLKQTKENFRQKYMNLKENYSDIPNDVIYKIFNNNPLFKQKFLYDTICGIKFKKDEANIKEDSEKDESESEYHNFYMSAYDFGNIKKLGGFKDLRIDDKKLKKTRNKNIIETFDSTKDNYLNFRRTMNSWKKDNFEKLYNKLCKNKENFEQTYYTNESKFISFKRKSNLNQRKQNSLEYAMVNPIEQNLYPRYFLPRSGSMLLKRKAPNEKKGKGKKKKK